MKMKRSMGEKIFDTANIVFMLLIIVIMLYPLWNTVVISFNDARDSIKGSLYLWPREFTLFNYQSIFKDDAIYNAFWVSVARTVIGTVFNVLFSSMLAYVLSRRTFVLRKFLTTFMVLTMYVNAGVIPQYFLFRDLHLLNNFLVYVAPSLLGAFNVIVIRTYVSSLPESLIESGKIDGARELTIFFRIIFPLCMPVVATVALFVAVGQWNAWMDTFLFASGKQSLSTLQYEMMKILSSSMISGPLQVDYQAEAGKARSMVTPNSLRAAMTVVATVPILVVYPFLQKYFVKGLNVGSVKE